MKKIEYRTFKAELRAAEEEGKPSKIVGYAAVFNQPSHPLWEDGREYVETIEPGAFTEALQSADLNVICNKDHDDTNMLGRTKSGTLRLAQDDHGLQIECDLPDTSLGRDLAFLMQRGDYTEMSFAFIATDDSWNEDRTARSVLSCELHDVAVVLDGAYPQTEVAVRDKKAKAKQKYRHKMLELREKEIR